MVLIWRGWGIVVVGIAILAFALGLAAGGLLKLDDRASSMLSGVFLVLAGIGMWFLGKRMNANSVRELVDPKTGQAVVVRKGHSFFFRRLEWWGPIMVVLGVFVFAVEMTSPSVSH